MKRKIKLLVLSLLAISCGSSQDSNPKFSSEIGKFQINFPSKPKTTKTSFTKAFGTLNVYSFLSEPKYNPNKYYSVSYLDYPKGFIDSLSTDDIYDLFLAKLTENMDTDKVNSLGTSNHTVLGYQGREYRGQEIRSGNFFRMRMFMVKNRMYQLTVDTNADNNFNKDINEFFDSFELLNTEPNPEKEQLAKVKEIEVYTINFPYPTKKKESETETEYGDAKIIAEAWQQSNEIDLNFAYMVVVMQYPEDISKSANFDINAHYSELVQNGLRNRQSTLISNKEIYHDEILGIETKENFMNGQVILTQQIFLKGKYQIVVTVMTQWANDENDAMRAFFDSLNLL